MVIVRPSRKLRGQLPVEPEDGAVSDTALGDWYVNRIVIDRRPLLLLVSSTSLLSILTPARNVRDLPSRIVDLVQQRLARLGLPRHILEAEAEVMAPVRLASTAHRSILGIMVDFAKMLPHALRPGFSETADLMEAEEFLWGNPCFAGKASRHVVIPRTKGPDLLRARWDAG